MAIQLRRGQFSRFDPTKLVPGEVAVVQSGDPSTIDGAAVYVCIVAGTVKQLATSGDLAAALHDAFAELEEQFSADMTSATSAANSAAIAANASKAAADAAASEAEAATEDAREAAKEARGAVSPDMSLYLDWVTDEDGDEILAVIDTSKE